MAMKDIPLGFKVDFDTKDVSARSKQLKQEIKRIFEKSSGKELTSQLASVQTRMAKVSSEADKLNAKLKELENTKAPTAEYIALKKTADETNQSFKDLIKKRAQLSSKMEELEARKRREGKDYRQSYEDLELKLAWKNVRQEVAEAQKISASARAQLDDLVEKGKAFKLGSETDEYKETEVKLRNVNNQMSTLVAQAYKVEPSLKKPFSGASKIMGAAKEGLKKVGGKILEIGKIASGKALEGIKKLGSAIKKTFISKPIDKMRMSLGYMIKSLLGAASIYAIFRRMMSAIKEGVTNLAKWNDGNNEVNASLSALMSSLATLKNSIGAAFAPILTVVTPILTKFIDMVTRAVNAVGAFFAALTGRRTVVRATKVNQNYAGSLDNVADSAEKANEALGAYDELNVIGQENTGGGGSSSGGGVSPNDMFEEVPIEANISEFADKIKEAWAKADFTEIGDMVGTKIATALNDIPWNEIQYNAKKLGKSLGTFIVGLCNSGIQTDKGWKSTPYIIGSTIGNAIQTGLVFVYELVSTPNLFESIGTAIADSLKGMLETIDWSKLGTTIVRTVQGLFKITKTILQDEQLWKDLGDAIVNTANGMISEFDPKLFADNLNLLAKRLWELFKRIVTEINWGELIGKIIEGIGHIDAGGWALIGLVMAPKLATSIGSGIISAMTSGVENASIGTLLPNLLKGAIVGLGIITIIVGIKYIYDTIKEEMSDGNGNWDPWFDEQGPDWYHDVFAGRDVQTQGGVIHIDSGVELMFKDLPIIGDGLKLLEDKISEIDGGLRDLGLTSDDVSFRSMTATQKMTAGWETFKVLVTVKWIEFKHKFDEIVQSISDKWNGVTSWIGGVWDGIVEGIKSGWQGFCDFFSGIGQWISGIWTGIVSWIGGVWDGIVGGIKGAWEGFSGLFSGVVSWIQGIWQGVTNTISNVWNGAVGWITSAWNSVGDKVWSVASSIGDVLGGLWDSAVSWGSDLIDGFIDGIRSMWNSLTSTVKGVAQTIADFLHFSVPDKGPLSDFDESGGDMIGVFVKGIKSSKNQLINTVSELASDINDEMIVEPDWMSSASSKMKLLNSTSLSSMTLPNITQGNIIPNNREFITELREQSSNNQELLNGITDVFRQVMTELDLGENSTNASPIVLQLNGKQLAQAVWDEDEKRYKQTGTRFAY